MEYLIEITGTCNLKCPSCPVGNYVDDDFDLKPREKGFMEAKLFEQIVEKAQYECSVRNEALSITLYNWGEPLIHPDIVNFVNLLAEKDIPFNISSNLNTEIPLGPIVKAGPASFRISMSGFTNPTYTKGHRGGDVNLVLSNMYRLRHYIEKQHKSIPVEVFYHVYKDNCDDDMVRLAALCSSLEFQLNPGWAYFTPIEKIIRYAANPSSLSSTELETLDRLVIPMDEALALARQVQSPECILRSHQMVINHDGSVALCCGVYDPKHFIADFFLDLDRDEIQLRKYRSELCQVCMGLGIHDAGCWLPNDQWDSLGMKKQIDAGQLIVTQMFTTPHIVTLDPPLQVEKIQFPKSGAQLA